jgi:ketosteroid isomerase-like protein
VRSTRFSHPWWTVVGLTAGLTGVAAAQSQQPLPHALEQMIDAERRFAARALEVGWRGAVLEYFAPAVVGFDGGAVGLAWTQIEDGAEPQDGHQLIWEPRYGDVAGSGELGYLTGPARSILPSRDGGRPRHLNYLTIWKRQRDGSFKVVMDAGIPTPSAVSYAPGFTRAPSANRFTGDYDETTPPLGTADGLLNAGLRTNQARAYRPILSPSARLHRPNLAPMVGERRIQQWLTSQPAFVTADSRYAEAARSGDLGYTWGTYAVRARGSARQGSYVRVWVRERDGQWKIAVDVLPE